MARFYDTLVKRRDCPPDCHACEDACAAKLGKTGPVIKAENIHKVARSRNFTCYQCAEPLCMEACPSDAIEKSEEDGVVRVIKEKCVGCEACVEACTYGNMFFDPNTWVAFKCEMCEGDPECVKACPYGSLEFVTNTESTRSHLRTEDLFTQGVGLCSGCVIETMSRVTGKVLGDNVVLFGTPGCCSRITQAINDQASARVPCYFCLMTNAASTAAGAKRIYQKNGQDIMSVVMVGDGATADVGFAGLSGAAERGENIIYICFDNEAYMATGIQSSGTTPFAAWTFTSPVGEMRAGKPNNSKYMPLIMADHGISYTATATVSHLEDYCMKLEKAKEVKDGLVYIHIFSPCYTGWRAPENSSLEISRMAVETNYFPLWECENGEYRLNYVPKNPLPVEEFTKTMGRFGHLTEEDTAAFQKMVDDRFHLIESLTHLKEKV
jgi:phenylglyoxylate dehydrogenase beta subunit